MYLKMIKYLLNILFKVESLKQKQHSLKRYTSTSHTLKKPHIKLLVQLFSVRPDWISNLKSNKSLCARS